MARIHKIIVGIVPTLVVDTDATRKALMIKNNGTASIFLNNSNQVTVANGFELPQGQQYTVSGDTDTYWGIAAALPQVVDTVEVI